MAYTYDVELEYTTPNKLSRTATLRNMEFANPIGKGGDSIEVRVTFLEPFVGEMPGFLQLGRVTDVVHRLGYTERDKTYEPRTVLMAKNVEKDPSPRLDEFVRAYEKEHHIHK